MKNRVSKKLVGLTLVLTLTLAVTSAASAQSGEFVKGVLQPLADGFPKRPITLINVDDAGSRDGIYARMFQQVLKPISPVPIIVSDEPAPTYGTFYKLKDVQSREGGKEGHYPIVLTVWGASTDTLTEPIKQELGMDLSDMNMVIVTELIPYMLVQKKNAPWGRTWADLVKYAKANPNQVKYISNQVGSGADIACEWLIRHVGLKVKKIPQPGPQECLATVGAGAGDFTLASSAALQPHWKAGKIDVILSMGPKVPPPWDKDPNVVSSEAAGLPRAPMGSILGFCVPKQVPKTHVDWLFKLFKAGASTDQYKQREKTIVALQISIMDPAQANDLKNTLYKFADPVVRSLGLHVDDQKKKK